MSVYIIYTENSGGVGHAEAKLVARGRSSSLRGGVGPSGAKLCSWKQSIFLRSEVFW
jgi:hypothetical protein